MNCVTSWRPPYHHAASIKPTEDASSHTPHNLGPSNRATILPQTTNARPVPLHEPSHDADTTLHHATPRQPSAPNPTIDNEDPGSDTDSIPELEPADDFDGPHIENDEASSEENQGENHETLEHTDSLDDTGNADTAAAGAVPSHTLGMGNIANPMLFTAFLANIMHESEDAPTSDSPDE